MVGHVTRSNIRMSNLVPQNLIRVRCEDYGNEGNFDTSGSAGLT